MAVETLMRAGLAKSKCGLIYCVEEGIKRIHPDYVFGCFHQTAWFCFFEIKSVWLHNWILRSALRFLLVNILTSFFKFAIFVTTVCVKPTEAGRKLEHLLFVH